MKRTKNMGPRVRRSQASDKGPCRLGKVWVQERRGFLSKEGDASGQEGPQRQSANPALQEAANSRPGADPEERCEQHLSPKASTSSSSKWALRGSAEHHLGQAQRCHV